MGHIPELIGLLVALSGMLWLLATALWFGRGRQAAIMVMTGLVFFLAGKSMLSIDTRYVGGREERTTETAILNSYQKGTGSLPANEREASCSQSNYAFSEGTLETLVGAVRYSFVGTNRYDGDGFRVVGDAPPTEVLVVVTNEGLTPVTLNPWFDFWVMAYPLDSILPHGPHPLSVDAMGGGGRFSVPTGRLFWLEPGKACSFLLTFLLSRNIEWARLSVGYVAAFNIDLGQRRRHKE